MAKAKLHESVQIMAEVGIMAAAGFILDMLAGVLFKGLFPNGGSISIAMICVLIVAFRRGFLPALGVGLIMGAFDLMKGPYLIASTPDRVFFQVVLDYIIAYPLVSLAGFVRPAFRGSQSKGNAIMWIIVGTLIGGIAKLFSHYLSGILFWADPSGFAWDLTWMNPHLYCILYNVAYTVPSIILSGLILCLAYIRAPQLFRPAGKTEEVEESVKKSDTVSVISIISALVGAVVFTFFLVRYIRSYEVYDDGYGVSHDFDRVALSLWILGALLIVFSLVALVNARRHYQWRVYPFCMGTVGFLSLLGNLSLLIRQLQKGAAEVTLWIWFALSIAIVLASAIYLFLRWNKKPVSEEASSSNA